MFKLIPPILFVILSTKLLFASELPDEVKWHNNLNTIIENQQFKKIGETTFSILFWDLYKSKLLTTSGNYPIIDDNDKLIYEINYLKDISSTDLLKRTIEQWQHIGVEAENYHAYLPLLKQIWPDINKGDTLSLIFDKQSSAFYYNQELIGIIDFPQFGQLFIDIWLAKNTSQPDLRNELLGKIAEQEVNNG
jgi:hypothetical protein